VKSARGHCPTCLKGPFGPLEPPHDRFPMTESKRTHLRKRRRRGSSIDPPYSRCFVAAVLQERVDQVSRWRVEFPPPRSPIPSPVCAIAVSFRVSELLPVRHAWGDGCPHRLLLHPECDGLLPYSRIDRQPGVSAPGQRGICCKQKTKGVTTEERENGASPYPSWATM